MERDNLKNEIQSLVNAIKAKGGWKETEKGVHWFNVEILEDVLAVFDADDQKIKELTELLDDKCDRCIARDKTTGALEVIGEVEALANNHIEAIGMLEPQNEFTSGGKQAFAIVLRFIAEFKEKCKEVSNESQTT